MDGPGGGAGLTSVTLVHDGCPVRSQCRVQLVGSVTSRLKGSPWLVRADQVPRGAEESAVRAAIALGTALAWRSHQSDEASHSRKRILLRTLAEVKLPGDVN